MGFPHSSAGKVSTCDVGDPDAIPGLGRSAGERRGCPLQYSWASLVAQLVKEFACNGEALGLIPGLGRSPGEGKGYPLQYSGQENSMDCIVLGVTESDVTEQLSLSRSKEGAEMFLLFKNWGIVGLQYCVSICCITCSILCNLMGFTVHGILQARILEWVAIPFSRESSQLWNQTQGSNIAGGLFTS